MNDNGHLSLHGPAPRRQTRPIMVGNVQIGGDAPVVVQSMCTTDTANVTATVAQIKRLEAAGCEIIRVSCLNMRQAQSIGKIKARINIPIVADIHFDHRFALAAVAEGADKIRLNPGNIRDRKKIEEVVEACKTARIPIRIGLNEGRLTFEAGVEAAAAEEPMPGVPGAPGAEGMLFANN